MKVGIFIGRMQPLHLGHEAVIINIFKNNNFVLIVLGSSGILDKNNIFSDKIRKDVLIKFLRINFISKKKYRIITLKDYKTDKEWIFNLNIKILKILTNNTRSILNKKDHTLTFYGGDLKNDYAISAVKSFKHLLYCKNINFKEINRDNYYIEYLGKKLKISSTLVRKAFKDKDLKLVKKLVNNNVFKEMVKLNKY